MVCYIDRTLRTDLCYDHSVNSTDLTVYSPAKHGDAYFSAVYIQKLAPHWKESWMEWNGMAALLQSSIEPEVSLIPTTLVAHYPIHDTLAHWLPLDVSDLWKIAIAVRIIMVCGASPLIRYKTSSKCCKKLPDFESNSWAIWDHSLVTTPFPTAHWTRFSRHFKC